MKRLISILLVLSLVFSFSSCGKIISAIENEVAESINGDGENKGILDSIDFSGALQGQGEENKENKSWEMEADVVKGQFGGEWPENEYTKLLPKPEIALVASATDDNQFGVVFQGATAEDIRAYAKKVESAGFSVDIVTEDQEILGMTTFTYKAQNNTGYTVEILFAMGLSSLTISKPQQ